MWTARYYRWRVVTATLVVKTEGGFHQFGSNEISTIFRIISWITDHVLLEVYSQINDCFDAGTKRTYEYFLYTGGR